MDETEEIERSSPPSLLYEQWDPFLRFADELNQLSHAKADKVNQSDQVEHELERRLTSVEIEIAAKEFGVQVFELPGADQWCRFFGGYWRVIGASQSDCGNPEALILEECDSPWMKYNFRLYRIDRRLWDERDGNV